MPGILSRGKATDVDKAVSVLNEFSLVYVYIFYHAIVL